MFPFRNIFILIVDTRKLLPYIKYIIKNMKRDIGMSLNNTDLELLSHMFTHGYKINELLDIFKISRKELQLIIKSKNLISPNRKRKQGDLYFCSKCKSYKSKDNFYKSKHNTHGIQSYCIPCNKVYQKKKSTFPQLKSKQEIAKSSSKRCSKCGNIKDVEFFSWAIKYKRLNSICKECDCNRNKDLFYKLLEKRGY